MILIFDTSIEGFSVGLFRSNGTEIHTIINDVPYSHTEWLVPTIQDLLKFCSTSFLDLTKIIVTKGPGSFTGIRVGLSTAAGLQAALNIPVITVNTLLALGYSWKLQQPDALPPFITALDTKCGEVYYQIYTEKNNLILPEADPKSAPVEQLKELYPTHTIITHPSSQNALRQLSIKVIPLTLSSLWHASQTIEPSDLKPLYIRPAKVGSLKRHA